MTTFKSYSDLLEVFPNAQYNDIDFNTITNEWIYKPANDSFLIGLLSLGGVALIGLFAFIITHC